MNNSLTGTIISTAGDNNSIEESFKKSLNSLYDNNNNNNAWGGSSKIITMTRSTRTATTEARDNTFSISNDGSGYGVGGAARDKIFGQLGVHRYHHEQCHDPVG